MMTRFCTGIFISITITLNLFVFVLAPTSANGHPYLKFVKYCTGFTIEASPLLVKTDLHITQECFAMCVRRRDTCRYIQFQQSQSPSGNLWTCTLFGMVDNLSNKLQPLNGATLYKVVNDTESSSAKTATTTTTSTVTTTTTTRTTPIPGSQTNCQQYVDQGHIESGVYNITINGKKREVYCEIDNGRGWIIISRRENGAVDFNKTWAEYKEGFGDLLSEFWIGNDAIHNITFGGEKFRFRMSGESFSGEKMTVTYTGFYIESEANNYTVHTGRYYLGDEQLKDDFLGNDGHPFTTYDVDNDNNTEKNCASVMGGGWWHSTSNCSLVNFNGVYYHQENLSTNASLSNNGMIWYRWGGFQKVLKKVSIKMRKQ